MSEPTMLVHKAVERHFTGRAIAQIQPIVGNQAGLMHLNYTVEFGDGGKAFYRGHNPTGLGVAGMDIYFGDPISLEREVEVMSLLRKTKVPVPDVYAFEENEYGKYLLLSFVEGIHFRQYLDEQGHKLDIFFDALRKIGCTLASTRAVTFDRCGSIQSTGLGDARDNYGDRLSDILGRHEKNPKVRGQFNTDEWAELMECVNRGLGFVREQYAEHKPQIVLYDLHSRNFNVYAGGERAGDLCSAFDVEFAQSAHGSLEWTPLEAVVFPMYGAKWFPLAKQAFLEGYGEGGGDSTVDPVLQQLHLVNHGLSATGFYSGLRDGIRDNWAGTFKGWVMGIVRGDYDPAFCADLTRPLHKAPKIE